MSAAATAEMPVNGASNSGSGDKKSEINVETKTRQIEEETFIIDGTPVQISGGEAEELKQAMMQGEIPNALITKVLAQLHLNEGQVATVSSQLTLKNNIETHDTKIIQKNGITVDEKTHVKREERETNKEQTDVFTPSSTRESSLEPQVQTFTKISSYDMSPVSPSSGTKPTREAIERILDAQGHLPLPELLRLLTPTPFFIPDPNFTFAFLLSARIFVSPLEIMQKVFEESFLSHGPSGATPNLVAFLSDWVELFPYDFREEPMMENLKSITKQCVARYEAHKKDVSPILQKLLDKLSSLEKHEEYIKEINKSSKPKTWSEHPPNRDIISVCPSPLDLAQQLTLVELRRLVYVGPEEIVYCLWRDPTISLPKALEKELAIAHANIRMANLEFYVDWFNRLSYLVASEICQYQRKRHRAKAIEYWIQVARECFNLGNFNSLMAILSGLSLGPVSRLKKTWTRVHNTQLSVLEHQMSPDSNFASYRSTLAAAKWRRSGAENGKVVADEQQERRKIIIPVFSVLIKDLQHTFQGCCHRLECGDFDFRSFSAMSEVVKELTDWQKVKCPFVEKEEVTTYLIHSPVFTETGLTLASFSCELPETEADKTRFKTLKSKMNAPNVDVTPTPALK